MEPYSKLLYRASWARRILHLKWRLCAHLWIMTNGMSKTEFKMYHFITSQWWYSCLHEQNVTISVGNTCCRHSHRQDETKLDALDVLEIKMLGEFVEYNGTCKRLKWSEIYRCAADILLLCFEKCAFCCCLYETSTTFCMPWSGDRLIIESHVTPWRIRANHGRLWRDYSNAVHMHTVNIRWLMRDELGTLLGMWTTKWELKLYKMTCLDYQSYKLE